MADIVRAELDPAVVEAEVGSVAEADNRIRIIKLVTSTINPKVVVVLEPFRMSQNHDADSERTESEFVGQEDFTSTANGAATMADAELGGHNQDVRIALGFREVSEELLCACRLAETLLVELTLTVVFELAVTGLLDGAEHLEEGFAVGSTEDGRVLHPVGDGEPAFGVFREFDFAFLDLREQVLIGKADAGEQDAELIALLVQSLRFVAGEIAVARFHFFVLELVGDRQVLERRGDRHANSFCEFIAVCMHTLCTVLVETEFRNCFFCGVGGDSGDLLQLTVCC